MIAQLDPLYIKTRPAKALIRFLSYAFFEGRPLTTKGRWINPFIFAHFWLEKKLLLKKHIQKPIFIIGTGRSGSTVLGKLLSMHQDVGFLNEPKALWHSIYPNEDIIGNYSLDSALYRLNAEDATEEVKRNARRLFNTYLLATRTKRVVDKYPELVFRVPFVRELFPDAKFVFLVRSAWNTCHSVYLWSERKGEQKNNNVHDWWGKNNRKWDLMLEQLIYTDPAFSDTYDAISQFKEHTDMAVAEWIVTMREGLRQMNNFPQDIFLLHYEDLVEQPRKQLMNLVEFCNLSDDEIFYRYAESILKSATVHPNFPLPIALKNLFAETMHTLGY